jgi:cell division protein FtsI (penicillin-binding protein 3)
MKFKNHKDFKTYFMKYVVAFLMLFSIKVNAQNTDNKTQSFSDQALLAAIKANQAVGGLAIVVDLSTNKIISYSAFSKKGGAYVQDTNLINTPIEPASLMLPISAAVIIDNFDVHLKNEVDLEGGSTIIDGKKIVDAEMHGIKNASLLNVIAESSNVGIAKLVNNTFKDKQTSSFFINKVQGYVGNAPVAKYIQDNNNLATLAFGYGLTLTPKQIFNFYTRVASDDNQMFTNPNTLQEVKAALAEVCSNGTARKLFSNLHYKVAGKTGTGLVANKNGYRDNQYLSSFIGYTSIDHPQYACMVMIKNKPNAVNHYGASVAGPVFNALIQNILTK